MFIKDEKTDEILFSRIKLTEDLLLFLLPIFLIYVAFYQFNNSKIWWGIFFIVFAGVMLCPPLIYAKEEIKTFKISISKQQLLIVNQGGEELKLPLSTVQLKIFILTGFSKRFPGFSFFNLRIKVFSNSDNKSKIAYTFTVPYRSGVKFLRYLKEWTHKNKIQLNFGSNGEYIIAQKYRHMVTTVFFVAFAITSIPLNFLYKKYFFTPDFLKFVYRPALFIIPFAIALAYIKLNPRLSLYQVHKKLEKFD